MHESFKRRLAELEEARKLQDGEPKMISIGFANEVEPMVAWTDNFECRRQAGEDEDTFRARAYAEARVIDPRPVQILIFSDLEETIDAT